MEGSSEQPWGSICHILRNGCRPPVYYNCCCYSPPKVGVEGLRDTELAITWIPHTAKTHRVDEGHGLIFPFRTIEALVVMSWVSSSSSRGHPWNYQWSICNKEGWRIAVTPPRPNNRAMSICVWACRAPSNYLDPRAP